MLTRCVPCLSSPRGARAATAAVVTAAMQLLRRRRAVACAASPYMSGARPSSWCGAVTALCVCTRHVGDHATSTSNNNNNNGNSNGSVTRRARVVVAAASPHHTVAADATTALTSTGVACHNNSHAHHHHHDGDTSAHNNSNTSSTSSSGSKTAATRGTAGGASTSVSSTTAAPQPRTRAPVRRKKKLLSLLHTKKKKVARRRSSDSSSNKRRTDADASAHVTPRARRSSSSGGSNGAAALTTTLSMAGAAVHGQTAAAAHGKHAAPAAATTSTSASADASRRRRRSDAAVALKTHRASSSDGGGGVATRTRRVRVARSRAGAPVARRRPARVVVAAAAAASPSFLTTQRGSRVAARRAIGVVKPLTTTAAAAAAAAAAAEAARRRKAARAKRAKKKVRVCVLNSSYEGTNSKTAAVDNFWCTPQHYVKRNKGKYTFTDVSVRKIDAYRVIRDLVTSGKYDLFFNLCDGARDEKRAGIDVVQALEEMNAAFTGTDSRSFEPNKITMKLLVASSGVRVPNFVLLHDDEGLAKKCRHLRFPVIVKHMSGYASVGVDKDSRCNSLDELRVKVRAFVAEYRHALVEEFVRGREGTVLACADAQSPHGVKVFRPLMFNFLSSPDDFAYFDKKWTVNFTGSAYTLMTSSDAAYGAIVDMARNAYKYIMNDVGYGRVDFRIDDATGAVYFLEINPNCGMWYSEKDGGDFADVMVQSDVYWDHERFFVNAVTRALREQAARRPWFIISHDKSGCFSTRATRSVPAGTCLFGDANHVVPVVAKALYKLGADEPTVGCVVCRGDGMQQAVAIRHSCEPNMHFVHGRTLLFASRRRISVGEELTVDYATLRDEAMPAFACSCGTENCRSVIFATPALPRTIELTSQRRMLREQKAAWLRAKANKAAERLIKKRTARSSSGSNSSTGGGGGSSAHALTSGTTGGSTGSSNNAVTTTTTTSAAHGGGGGGNNASSGK